LVGEKMGHIGHYQGADFLCIIVLCLVPSFFFCFFQSPIGLTLEIAANWAWDEKNREPERGANWG